MSTAPLPNPEILHDYGDGWRSCRIPFRCRCGTRGELILCRTEDYAVAVAEAKADKMLCGECEKQSVKTQPNPVVRLAKLTNVMDVELDEAVHTTANDDGLVSKVRWVVEEPAEP